MGELVTDMFHCTDIFPSTHQTTLRGPGGICYKLVTDDKTEAQRGSIACARPPGWWVTERTPGPRFPGPPFCSQACERGAGGLPHLGAKSLGFLLPFIPAPCSVAAETGEGWDQLKKVALRKEAAAVQDQVGQTGNKASPFLCGKLDIWCLKKSPTFLKHSKFLKTPCCSNQAHA